MARQKLDLLRITIFSFPDLKFGPSLCISLKFLFSQLQTYIRLILRAITQGYKEKQIIFLWEKLLHLYTIGFLLGYKDLGLNVQNHIFIVFANREQNMFSLGLQAMLKSGCFKVQVQLITEKGSVVLPCLTDQELGLTD